MVDIGYFTSKRKKKKYMFISPNFFNSHLNIRLITTLTEYMGITKLLSIFCTIHYKVVMPKFTCSVIQLIYILILIYLDKIV